MLINNDIIKGVFVSIRTVRDALKQAIKQCNHDSMPVSIIGIKEGSSNENLNHLEPVFMYSQIFKEILLDIEYDQEAPKDLAEFCKLQYEDDPKEIKIINHQMQYLDLLQTMINN